MDELESRRSVARNVQIAFWSAAVLAVGTVAGALSDHAWLGAALLPGMLGVYGLYVANGKLLNELDKSRSGN